MNPDQLAQMAGTNAYKGGHVGGSQYDTITLGKDGKFYLAYYSQPKDQREDPIVIGSKVSLTILKIRQKFIYWKDNTKVLESVEYDAGADLIDTNQGKMTEKDAKCIDGFTDETDEEKPKPIGAKVSRVIYAKYKDGIVKLQVTGGSLYNPDDTENLRLLNYLQSFEGDDHVFMYETTVKAKEVEYKNRETGKTETTYHMTFTKDKASDLEAVGVLLTKLVAELPENDASALKFLGYTKKTEASYEGSKAPDYPEDEINPEDIPF
jgi:hypothetical protein